MSHRGVLSEPGVGVVSGLLPSAGLHATLIALFVVFGSQPPPRRPPLEKDAFMVSAVVLPQSKSLPTKAAAPPPPERGDQGVTPDLPPPRPDQMVLPEKQAPKKEGEKPVNKKEPEQRKEEPKKRKRPDLSSLIPESEETSSEPIFETSPDGDPNAKPEAGLRQRFGKALSPYQRQVGDIVKNNWFPKSSRGEPPREFLAAVTFRIDDQGTILEPSLSHSSGDFVYDQSCLRAVQRTRRVPAPPTGEVRTITVGFSPEDKR